MHYQLEVKTSFELFPMIKPFFIEEDYYVIGVQTIKNQGIFSRYNPFIILKNFSLDAWGFNLYREKINLDEDCYKESETPVMVLINSYTESELLEFHNNKKSVNMSGVLLPIIHNLIS